MLFLCIGISIRTIERVIKEANTALASTGNIQFSSPRKKRVKRSPVTDIPEYQLSDIRHIVHDFHKTEGCRVTVATLANKIRNELDWNGSNESVRLILKKLGFRWRRTQNNRKVLIERSDIRSLRIAYLQKIKYFRKENRPIVYLDETYLHSGHTSSKNWTDETTKGLFANISKGPRLIIVHAGGATGFVPNALLMFRSGTKSGDYHADMNAANYGKWLEEKLIPNLPPHSVIVTDNAPYHNVQVDPAPTSTARKATMIQWLTDKNINFRPDMLKPELYAIIKRNKQHHIKYKFDLLLQQHGHTALRLPPYHPDLNPIELIWATVKNNVARKNVTFKLQDAQQLAQQEFEKITAEDWHKRCQHVIHIEDKYIEMEPIIDHFEEVNELIINLESVSSESDNWSDDSST